MHAPLQKNQVVGTINFQLDGKTIEQRPWLCCKKSRGDSSAKSSITLNYVPSLVWLKIDTLNYNFRPHILSISKILRLLAELRLNYVTPELT
ncbi:hypothetical protein ACLK19_04305 [Escherichia coli]